MPSPSAPSAYLSSLGLGYTIAVTLAFLLLLSTVLLASYICCRSSRLPSNSPAHSPPAGVILPRVLFVADDDGDLERGGDSAAVGLDAAVINSYPKLQFSKEEGFDLSCTTCSICLCDFRDFEMLRMMPECRHFFHLGCLDAWLKLNGSCPVCRNSPLPTPMSTPLSEVVPLSQFPADRRRGR